MSTQINLEMVDLDNEASAFLAAFIATKAEIKRLEAVADEYAERVKAAMGECEIGLVNGKESVRWTKVETTRVDTAKIKTLFLDKLNETDRATFETKIISRRFSIVED